MLDEFALRPTSMQATFRGRPRFGWIAENRGVGSMMKAARDGVIIVFGLSAVGKTRMITSLVAQNDFRHVSASALLREARLKIDKRSSSSEDLRKGAVLDNQAYLLEAFEELRSSEKRSIIIDAHNLIDTDTDLVEIPESVVSGFTPDAVIFIFDEPEAIRNRRALDKTRVRPQRSSTELKAQQERAIEIAQRHASSIGIDCALVRSGDEVAFRSAVTAFVRAKLT